MAVSFPPAPGVLAGPGSIATLVENCPAHSVSRPAVRYILESITITKQHRRASEPPNYHVWGNRRPEKPG